MPVTFKKFWNLLLLENREYIISLIISMYQSISSHWYIFHLLINRLTNSSIYLSVSLGKVTISTKIITGKKKWVRQLNVRHVIMWPVVLGCGHHMCDFFIILLNQTLYQHWRIYSVDQHQKFELHLLRLLCSSQKSTTQSNFRFIEDRHIWNRKSVWIVSIWSVLN